MVRGGASGSALRALRCLAGRALLGSGQWSGDRGLLAETDGLRNVKHLMDLRASGGIWSAAEELDPEDYADGIDELLSVFLPRSRPKLAALPGEVALVATDTPRRWFVGPDWTVRISSGDSDEATAARIFARTGDLALMVWERADPLTDSRRFRVEGGLATAAAFSATSIHPW